MDRTPSVFRIRLLSVVFLLGACAGSPKPNGVGADPGADAASGDAGAKVYCADGFERSTKTQPRLVARITPEPEGVAVCPNGDVFVSIPDEGRIVRVPLAGGEPEPWTTLSGRQPLGLTCVENVLFVADFRIEDAAVLRIAAQNDPGTALPKIEGDPGYSALNAIASVPGIGIFATDASNGSAGRIVRFAETSPGVFRASVVKQDLPYPNGITFEPKKRTLDVALTLGSKVVSFPIGSGDALGQGTDAWSGTPIEDAIDGVARDENEALYVAHYLRGFVGRNEEMIATATHPKSLAFRGSTLLFTSADGLHAVDVGVCGAHP